MTPAPCLVCGRPSAEAHHVIGKVIAAPTVPLCARDHHDFHNQLRGLGYDKLGDAVLPGAAGVVELGLRRLHVFMDWLNATQVPAPLSILATVVADLADLLGSKP